MAVRNWQNFAQHYSQMKGLRSWNSVSFQIKKHIDAHIPPTQGAGIGIVSVALAVLRSGLNLGSEQDLILTTDVGVSSYLIFFMLHKI